ncbi:MAG: hypothetical protein CMQ07_08725 [Gammaproteobacteria bacterium]|nr:hypothetical protein [Gammaproteobacteria bacterium]
MDTRSFKTASLLVIVSLPLISKTFAVDTFDPATGILSVPRVVVGDWRLTWGAQEYTEIKLTVDEVVSVGQTTLLDETDLTIRPDTFDTSLNQLLMPQVIVGSDVYADVVITIGELISFTGTITEVGSPAYSQARSLQPFYYSYSDDVPQNLRELWEIGIEAAAKYFGRYGPLELWMQGASEEGLTSHIAKLCDRRKVIGKPYMTLESCMSRWGERFQYYQRKSAISEWAAAYAWAFSEGYHLIISAIPGYFEKEYIHQDRAFIGPFHEYYHAIQHAHVSHLTSHSQRSAILGPKWFVEGVAGALADYAVMDMQSNGTLPLLDGRAYDFFDHQAQHLDLARHQWQSLDDPKLGLTSEEMRPTFYSNSFAAWLLLSRTKVNILETTFYPNLMKKGWEQTFVDTFGMSSEDFYLLFADYMTKEPEEQLAIMPGWDALSRSEKDYYLSRF